MTQEEKELLLKDLCARLPYGVKCYYNSHEIDDDIPEGISVIKGFQNEGILVEIESGDIIDIEDVKPYLRPMSSMTEEEKKKILHLLGYDVYICEDFNLLADSASHIIQWTSIQTYIDWLNSHHFDYRGLIEKGLAIEAPEDMYKK